MVGTLRREASTTLLYRRRMKSLGRVRRAASMAAPVVNVVTEAEAPRLPTALRQQS